MKLSNIHESDHDKLKKAILSFLQRLTTQGYHLVEHVWEESSGNCYDGLFLAKHPQKLATYKLRDFTTPDAYHLGRNYIEDQIDWGGKKINPQYADLAAKLKAQYPDFDELLQLDGVAVPHTPELLTLFQQLNIPYEIDNGRIWPDITIDDNINYTEILEPPQIFQKIDDTDLPAIAQRLYDILGGNAPRWQEYRLDTKTTQDINWKGILDTHQNDDPADWWK